MLAIETQVTELTDIRVSDIPDEVLHSPTPVILRDFANDWPVVKAAKISDESAADYLRSHYSGEPILASYGQPETQGRVFYNDTMDGFNLNSSQINLNQLLDKLLEHRNDSNPPTMYMASTDTRRWFPDFSKENPCNIPNIEPITSLWIGNQSRIAAHYDFPTNVACNVIGKRRFTLFPPDQIGNLYVGPIGFAPGGQEISLVDFANPDFQKYPKFRDAVKQAQVAELNPGDALILPSMWWHHVEGLTPFNALVTHWWRDTPGYLGRPNNALSAAMLGIRSLPKEQRKAWKAIFEHYIFNEDLDDHDHIPDQAKDILTLPLDENSARKLRADLLNKLKR